MVVSFIHSIFGLCSLSLGITILIAYIFISGLRKPPGMLILWQTVLQIVLDVEWGIVGLLHSGLNSSVSNNSCIGLGILAVYCFYVVWNYYFCLVIELVIKLKDPMNGNYKKRSPIYHITSHICGFAFTLYAIIRDQAGKSLLLTCFIKRNALLLNILPLCTYYPVVILGIFYLSSLVKSSTSKLMKKYVYMYLFSLIVYTIVWINLSTAMIINNENSHFTQATELVGSFSGIIINLLRISDPAFWNYIKSRVKRPRRKESLTRFNSVYESSYIQMFTHVFSVAVLKSIISLNLSMGVDEEYEENNILWSREHYDQQQNLRFDEDDVKKNLIIPDSIDYAVEGFKCNAKIYCPLVFQHIRNLCGITNDMICQSFEVVTNLPSLKSNAGNSGGRSASFFYFSHDRRFLLKTICTSEKNFLLRELLVDYHKFLIDHEDSILSRIIGVFTFRFQDGTKCKVMLQSNIFPIVPLIGVFDLKGSKVDRTVSKSSRGVSEIVPEIIYKDLDFLSTKKKIHIEEIDLQRFKISILKDSKFLNDHNIIDYSLLLGMSQDFVSNSRPLIGYGKDKGLFYYVGIIDYLQTYTTFKQLEAFSKNLIMLNVPKEDISVTSSDLYGDRFTAFLFSIIST